MKDFIGFLDKKSRESKHQLQLIGDIVKKHGMKSEQHLDDNDPYLFIFGPDKLHLSFDGIRIYKIGDILAFRVQKESSTHPYGKAYPLDVEEMYNDLLSDKMDEEAAGKKVMEAIVKEIETFFQKSHDAEKEINNNNDPMGKVIMGSSATGTDYSSMVFNKSP